MTFRCRDFATANSAINAYLKKINTPHPDVICIAAAGPVIEGKVRFTNNSWSPETDDPDAVKRLPEGIGYPLMV